ncbi:hypothetical protein PT974_11297 [Cladobotryum mycophilum]|uniref:Uncharacterized protein n=1 Tax=Cladobotryum mycophilum TaxID=491253 RepID=A0ABR0S4U1_9HYPO
MTSAKLLLLSATVALAGVVPRRYIPDGYCCFTLSDTTTGKTVQQDEHTGILYFDAQQTDGWYCMDSADTRDVLWDTYGNACIIAQNQQFQCLDPTRGSNLWTLGKGGDNNNKLLLSYDATPNYEACPNGESGGEIVYSNNTNVAGCRVMQLTAQGLQGACQGFTQ